MMCSECPLLLPAKSVFKLIVNIFIFHTTFLTFTYRGTPSAVLHLQSPLHALLQQQWSNKEYD